MAYACFIIDAYSRTIVGWRVASHMRTETVLDAIEMARWSRGKHFPGLRCHSDAGSQFTSIRMANASRKSALFPPLGALGTVTITLWLKQSTGITRLNRLEDQTTQDPGKPLKSWSWRPSAGFIGITGNASTGSSATSRRQSSKKRSMLKTVRQKPWQKTQL